MEALLLRVFLCEKSIAHMAERVKTNTFRENEFCFIKFVFIKILIEIEGSKFEIEVMILRHH